MTTRTLLSILVGLASPAFADTAPTRLESSSTIPAAVGGIEIALALSAADSNGDIGDGVDADDLIGSAVQLDVEIGRRITPNMTLGFYSSAQALAQGSRDGRSVHTGAAGIEADFHLAPDYSLDPWVSIGAGVRAYLVDDGDYTIGVGAELARLQIGVDFRSDKHFAIGPVFGASASLYGAEKQPMEGFRELSDKGINWTFTGGIAGRFNLFSR